MPLVLGFDDVTVRSSGGISVSQQVQHVRQLHAGLRQLIAHLRVAEALRFQHILAHCCTRGHVRKDTMHCQQQQQ